MSSRAFSSATCGTAWPKRGGLRQFAIDEFSASKGYRYLTVVQNLETGAVVFVSDGRSGNALLKAAPPGQIAGRGAGR